MEDSVDIQLVNRERSLRADRGQADGGREPLRADRGQADGGREPLRVDRGQADGGREDIGESQTTARLSQLSLNSSALT